ncbi:MAG: type II toxin-antitoxin system RelE/ParE family toxin [Elusimicrobiota bacterium]
MKKNIIYKKSVSKDFERIGCHQRLKIINQIERHLVENAGQGKRLTGDFAGLFRLRVGDYRVIYTIIPEAVLVLKIAHRKEIYR